MQKILVVIDCQNDFITGSLRNEDAIAAVPRIVEKIKNFNGERILVTQDTHSNDYLLTNEGKKLPVVHCVGNTDGWRIEGSIQQALDEAYARNIDVDYFNKPTFGSQDLISFLCSAVGYTKYVEVEFVGFCTDICVVSNVLMAKASLYDKAEISVDASCCAGVTPESHKAALTTMQMCQINIINKDFVDNEYEDVNESGPTSNSGE